jgi:hypothetical protein
MDIRLAHVTFFLTNFAVEVVPNSENPVGKGLIGLGPNSGSNIFQELNNSAGDAVLDRIFLQNTSTPNYLTVNLGRSEGRYNRTL